MLLAIIIVSFAFMLGQQAKEKEEKSRELELTIQQSVARNLSLLEHLPHVVLLKFFEAWQNDDDTTAVQATLLQRMLDGMEGKSDSQEKAAMIVLRQAATSETLDQAALAPLRKYPRWFTHLLAGEWHLKRNNREQALAAYRLSHQALLMDLVEGGRPATSYRQYIQSRLYELGNGSKAGLIGAP